MHGKDHLAREPFARILGALVTAPPALDTDRDGTFSGETPRTLSPVAAARAKAQAGVQTMAIPLALASEGSFSSVSGFGIEHSELLLFLDVERGLELLETVITTSPLPPRRTVESVEEAGDYALVAGFPRQGVLMRASTHDGNLHHKDFATFEALEEMASKLLAGPDTHSVTLEPDFRAHASPTRATAIRSLAVRMAKRLATNCAECGTPGFGQIDVERGLPCANCHSATSMIATDVHGCGSCGATHRKPRFQRSAAPESCDECNP